MHGMGKITMSATETRKILSKCFGAVPGAKSRVIQVPAKTSDREIDDFLESHKRFLERSAKISIPVR